MDPDKVPTATLQQLAILGWGPGSRATLYSEVKYRAIYGFSKLRSPNWTSGTCFKWSTAL